MTALERLRLDVRVFRQALALAIAPWLEAPAPDGFGLCDLRAGGPCTEAAALVGGQTWVRELLERGLPVPDHVTIFYVPITGLDAAGNGYRVTSISRDEPGIGTAGRR